MRKFTEGESHLQACVHRHAGPQPADMKQSDALMHFALFGACIILQSCISIGHFQVSPIALHPALLSAWSQMQRPVLRHISSRVDLLQLFVSIDPGCQ